MSSFFLIFVLILYVYPAVKYGKISDYERGCRRHLQYYTQTKLMKEEAAAVQPHYFKTQCQSQMRTIE